MILFEFWAIIIKNKKGTLVNNRIKYNCVFGGGGIRGMCYIGAIKALKELDIPINAIAGSSVGAVFAALYAAGYNESEIQELFFDFNFNMFRDINIGLFTPDFSLSKGEIFLDWLKEKIANKVKHKTSDEPEKITFSDLKQDLYILTLDLNTNMPYVFSKETTPDEEVAFAVRCSACLPGLMKPVSYNGMLLVDGDLIKSWPACKIYSELNNSKTRILEFRLEGSRNGANIKNPADYLNSVINAIWYLSTENVFTDYGANDRYDNIVIDTKDVIMFDFSIGKDKKEELTEMGYKKTKEFLCKTFVKKKLKLLSLYQNLRERVCNLEQSTEKNNADKAVTLVSELASFAFENKEYIDDSILEQIKELKKDYTKGYKMNFLLVKSFAKEAEIKVQIEFLKDILQNRISDICEYVAKYKNIS